MADTDRGRLLRGMDPVLREGRYVFATLEHGDARALALDAVMTFKEHEGITLILEHDRAEAAGLAHQFPCRMITLTVHSALDAVGFLAAVAGALAEAGIPSNAVSAAFHDHLFVPDARAEDAMAVLRRLAADA